jgi:hypothetical protein
VRAVTGIEPGVLPDPGVGGQRGVPVAVALFDQIQLRAGMRPFPAHDHPRPRRVADQRRRGQQAGEFGDGGLVDRPRISVGVHRRGPVAGLQLRDGGVLAAGAGGSRTTA